MAGNKKFEIDGENMDGNNIVFKCNFCDGGKNKNVFGFNGICTKEMINYNIGKKGRSWCSHQNSYCRQYYDGEIDYEELKEISKEESLCYESQLLNKWIAYAGWDNNNRVKPRSISNAKIGKLTVLTVVYPNDDEKERRIFAVFLIDDYYKGDGKDNEGYVACNSEYKINFTPNETSRMKFWDFYRNENSDECQWGSGLTRYIDDITAVQILKQAYNVKKNTADEQLANKFLNHYCKINGVSLNEIPEPDGSRNEKRKGYITI